MPQPKQSFAISRKASPVHGRSIQEKEDAYMAGSGFVGTVESCAARHPHSPPFLPFMLRQRIISESSPGPTFPC